MKGLPRIFVALLPLAAASLIAVPLLSQGCSRAGRDAPYTGPSLVQHIEGNAFAALLDQSATPVAVNFWAPWCGPCRTLSPTLDKLSLEFEGRLKVVKVNVDDHQALAESFSIRSIPTTLIFKDGRSIATRTGAGREDDFRQWFAAQL